MRVCITGASGTIGRHLVRGLTDAGHDVLALDVAEPPPNLPDGVQHAVADCRDVAALSSLITGYDAVVHLAAIPGETDFEAALDSHLRGTYGVLEAMRHTGVRRIVYASSNHAVGFTPRTDSLSVDTRPRPDTFYGVGKVGAEALCSLYVDRYDLSAACLRIGSFVERPHTRRHLSTWLSPADAVRLVAACLTSLDLGFAVVYGVSANTRNWWDLAPARALGYEPQDDAERYADDILSGPETDQDRFEASLVGGDFCGPDYDLPHP